MEQDVLAQLLALISLSSLLHACGVLLAVWLALHALKVAIDRLAQRFPRHRQRVQQTFPVMRLLAWVAAALYIVFIIIHPPQGVMYALLGSLGLAVGLAAQDGIRNLLAGTMMLFNPPFRVGDMVEIGGQYGEVVRLDLSVTWLRTFDDNTVMVPNAEILKQAVVNSNSGELYEMVVVTLDLPVTVPVRAVKELAADAARRCPYTYLKLPINVMVEPRHDRRFLLRFSIKAYVTDVRLDRLMASDIAERTFEELAARQLIDARWDVPA